MTTTELKERARATHKRLRQQGCEASTLLGLEDLQRACDAGMDRKDIFVAVQALDMLDKTYPYLN